MAKGEKWDIDALGSVRLQVPPVGHALPKFDEEARVLTYDYNGRPLLRIELNTERIIGYRHSSDGDIQSLPFVQQLYVMLDEPGDAVDAKVTLTLAKDAVVMLPHRAPAGRAIIAQVGRPLIDGINGAYDLQQDMLIEWYGRPWRWLGDEFQRNADGDMTASFEVSISQMPWIVNLRPHYYRQHLGYRYHKPWKQRPNPKAVSGWCSWEAYRRDVNQEHIRQVSEFMSKHLKPYGLEYVQVDDGFMETPIPHDPSASIAKTWLTTNEQFPGGHDGIVDTIRANGLAPGIWASCSISNPEFADKQPEGLVKDQNGKCFEGDWVGLVLDCLPDTLKQHVKPCFEGLRDFGYDYLKIDQIRHLCMDGLRKAAAAGLMSDDDAESRFRAYLECVREGLGSDIYFLASWGVVSQVAGLADACRISMDANPTWPGVRMQMVETARWFHAQRILFTIDPDHVCVRAELEWVRSLLSLVSLSGGLFMLSDPLSSYDDQRLEIIRKCLPPLTTVTGETGALDLTYPAYTWTKLHGFAVPREKPVEAEGVSEEDARNLAGDFAAMSGTHPFSSLWAVHLKVSGRRWTVVGRFAVNALDACALPLENCGLRPNSAFHAFDFWAQKYMGIHTGTVPVHSLTLGHCQVIALTAAEERPQLVGSSRHVSMDAVSVCSEKWSQNELAVELQGIPGTQETYWFAIPAGFSLRDAVADGAEVAWRNEAGCVPVSVNFTDVRASLRLMFG